MKQILSLTNYNFEQILYVCKCTGTMYPLVTNVLYTLYISISLCPKGGLSQWVARQIFKFSQYTRTKVVLS